MRSTLRTTRRGARAPARPASTADDGDGHEDDRERVCLSDVQLARAGRGSERSRREASVDPGARGRRWHRTRRGRSRRRTQRRLRVRARRSADRPHGALAPVTRRAAPPPRAGAGRSSGGSARRSERRTGSRRAPARRNDPRRRSEVERAGIERDEEAEAEHHRRGAERQQDQAVEEPRPARVGNGERGKPADDERDRGRH